MNTKHNTDGAIIYRQVGQPEDWPGPSARHSHTSLSLYRNSQKMPFIAGPSGVMGQSLNNLKYPYDRFVPIPENSQIKDSNI